MIDSAQKVDRSLYRWVMEIFDWVFDVEVVRRGGVDDGLEGRRGLNRLCTAVSMGLIRGIKATKGSAAGPILFTYDVKGPFSRNVAYDNIGKLPSEGFRTSVENLTTLFQGPDSCYNFEAERASVPSSTVYDFGGGDTHDLIIYQGYGRPESRCLLDQFPTISKSTNYDGDRRHQRTNVVRECSPVSKTLAIWNMLLDKIIARQCLDFLLSRVDTSRREW